MEKIILSEAGLGCKSIPFDPMLQQKEMREILIENFPCLTSGGGFEFLRCVSNSRDLELIPPNFYVSPRHLKAFIGDGKVYVRPLQRDLMTDVGIVDDEVIHIILHVD